MNHVLAMLTSPICKGARKLEKPLRANKERLVTPDQPFDMGGCPTHVLAGAKWHQGAYPASDAC